ncbi:hypothetical protein [Arsukibacterium indicum]|uniref:Uncharacterized protein n=1 Tax=Arsukibacterium indicum TaxID=2848612 RepID=A0ABS6MHD0_9GAMM|nr:hypothetical protein [Arsukibacterium indicum]MBV2128197.1 hypothetical protein [Arsukibacterium indicum]
MKRLTISKSSDVKELEKTVMRAEQDFLEASKEYHAARLKLAHALLAEGKGYRSENYRVVREGQAKKQLFDWKSYAIENGISMKVINRYMRNTYHNRRLTVSRINKSGGAV